MDAMTVLDTKHIVSTRRRDADREGTQMMTATLFQDGHSQAVRLPEAIRLPGTAVYIKQVGNALVLLPLDQPWEPLLESLTHFSEDFMRERDQPPVETRDDAFAS
jgi:antitoxin VapB